VERPGGSGASAGELLESVLAALERGEQIDWERIRREHAHDPRLVASVARALEGYCGILRKVRSVRRSPWLVPGETLGDFEVVDLLATGGMGEVYRARQRSLGGRLVALKVMRVAARSTESERFEREALVLSGLHHSNLAEVYGFGAVGDVRFLAMRLVPGSSLAELQGERRAIAPETAVAWVMDVAAALAVVHASGQVHRDVKPANVVIEEAQGSPSVPLQGRQGDVGQIGRAVLVDFGLARPVDGGTRTRSSLAPMTRAYAAPEQLLGLKVDSRSDVFSLGVVLHELLSGTRPSDAEPAAARLLVVPRGAGIDDDLRAIVAMATAEHRAQRYADAAALLADLHAWRERRPVVARRHAWRERMKSFLSRNKTRVPRWVGIWLAACAALGLLAWGETLLERGRSVRAAAQTLDLPGLRFEYACIPEALGDWLIRDPTALALAHRVSADAREDPLALVTDLLLAKDMEGAMKAAAIQVSALGPGGDPASLGVLVNLTRGQLPSSLRAIEWLALAASARPRVGIGADSACEPVLVLARQSLRELDAPLPARLAALTLLGALGTVADGKWLAEQLCSLPVASEEFRLACESLERVVRRSASTPESAPVLDDLPWLALMERVRSLRADGAVGAGWGTVTALQRLMVAVHLARRREGRTTDACAVLPAAWLVEPGIRWVGLGSFETPLELAASGDARAKGVLEVLERERIRGWQADLVGRIAAFLADRAWSIAAAEHLTRIGWEPREVRLAVEASYAAGHAEFHAGHSQADAPDDGGLLTLAPTVGSPRRIEMHRVAPGPDTPNHVDAMWSFTEDAPSLAGCASGVEGTAVDLRREGSDPASLLFGHIGASEIALELDHRRDVAAEWSLVVLGQASARRYLPHQGLVRLELYLDGRRVATQSLSHIGKGVEEFEIPATWFDPGWHVFTLRLGAESTTSYRLLQVRMERRRN
jgi:hypothetical protein